MQENYRPVGFSILPPVVKNLLIINGLCYMLSLVLQDRMGIDINRYVGLFHPESVYFRPYQLVTHLFMHGSFTHLLFNMFSLWMFGSVLENYWGPKRFLIYYFITGLGAAALHLGVSMYEVHQVKVVVQDYLANPSYNAFYTLQQINGNLFDTEQLQQFLQSWNMDQSNTQYIQYSQEIANAILQRQLNIPTVGASGAVYGLLLAFGMLFPNTLLFMIFIPIPIKAKYFVMIYGALELYQGVANNAGDNVAHFAHLGGMLFGYFLIKYWNKRRRDTFY
ncbi:MAG: rhomboid family intramembrane serine protease [Bacteroidia bacterium]|nr:rhomboid family intramembrane serine protease [Bacteroidia bacterium]MCZ2141754.1 rhomboid family intramembrane serine protease [Bacteroidia bacterium]